jgi:hypothetical protein
MISQNDKIICGHYDGTLTITDLSLESHPETIFEF